MAKPSSLLLLFLSLAACMLPFYRKLTHSFSYPDIMHHAQTRRTESSARMPSAPHASSNAFSRTAPSGLRTQYGLDTRSSLVRPDSPSNESSASTDDDYRSANADPHALEYYLGNDDTWRDAEIYSQSSEDSGLSDDGGAIARHFKDAYHPDDDPFNLGSSQFPNPSHSDMGVYPYVYQQHTRRVQRRPDRAPRMPKRVPVVPTCSKSRKRASMRSAWKMRFGRLFESDSEAGTEVEDELDWEGYESADARRIVAMRIQKAGGGDGRKVMEGKNQLSELLVKKPVDARRLAGRVPRRRRADTARGRVRADTGATIQPSAVTVDTCPTCATSQTSPSLSMRSMTTNSESPSLSNSGSLSSPTSTPPTSVPNTPCPSCAQLSPRGDALGLSIPRAVRRRSLSPRSPPFKTTPLSAGTDPLTVFAIAIEQEKQRDFSGLLKHSVPRPESMLTVMSTGLMRGVKSLFGRINNLVELAASAPLPTSVDGTCALSPVMGVTAGGAIGTRRRSATVPANSPTSTRTRSQRRRSILRSPTGTKSQLGLPAAPTSPYGYRVRPQEVLAAFPTLVGLNERVQNVESAPVPEIEGLESAAVTAAVELKPVVEFKPAVGRLEADTALPRQQSDEVEVKVAPPAEKQRRASRSPSRRRSSGRRAPKANSGAGREKLSRSVVVDENRDELTRPRTVVDSKYWRVLAGEMQQRRRGGSEVAFMVRLAVEEGRNLPIFTSEEQQAATGEIVVGGVWKATLSRWRVGGVGRGPTRIRSSLINEVYSQSEASDTVSDSSISP
ncbi:hypothetical protein BDV93DRAFT_118454 [Ceratobasidium sp. AG-I]|nr:hypothetical protein BDV93DRAFT_118454 [Ceratobasidium sp. AG-I]